MAGNRLVLESLGLVKDPDNGPVKPKRVFSKKVYERNPERVLRPQVIRCSADWTPVTEPPKSTSRQKFVARTEPANIHRIDPATIAQPFRPPCVRCGGDSEACAEAPKDEAQQKQGNNRPSYRCKNAACAHVWRVNLCTRCRQPKKGHICPVAHHAVPLVPGALVLRQRICDIEAAPPPPDWRWPVEGAAIEVMASATDDEAPFWRPASVTAVLVDGWIGARLRLPAGREAWPDGSPEWQDWFKWDEEGVDWRRAKRKRQEVGVEEGAVVVTVAGRCGTPGCDKPDFHAGPCTCAVVGTRTRRGA